MMKFPTAHIIPAMAAAALLGGVMAGCRHDEVIVPSSSVEVGDRQFGPYAGFYLLNEGNMGSNKCTLDWYDYSDGTYTRNIYAERNPGAVMELGDVGNDIGIYGSKLYAVINCSHKVEVMDARTGIRLGQIDIPNCRYLTFHGGKAYVSSYVGPVQVDPDAPKGAVFEIDTTRIAVSRTVTVGYQPEQMAVADGYLYVANSGGYMPPVYDNTVSVVDLATFKEIRRIPVDINLHLMCRDSYGRLWVSSRGNNGDIPPRLYMLSREEDSPIYSRVRQFDIPVSAMAIHADRLYYLHSGDNPLSGATYGMIDLARLEASAGSFITDGTGASITRPYCLAVNPDNGDIFVSDAKNYVSSGTLYCFDSSGQQKWHVTTGDIPSAITFAPR